MKKLLVREILFTALALFTLSACGGGGGGGGNGETQPTTAVLKISTQGSLAGGTQIGGINISINLPAGVTVKATADANSGLLVTDAGVVTASGAAAGTNATVLAVYTAGPPATVSINLANPNGFSTGEFVTVNCDIAAGNSPKSADFSLADFNAVDLNGAAVTGLTPGFTAGIK